MSKEQKAIHELCVILIYVIHALANEMGTQWVYDQVEEVNKILDFLKREE